MDFTQPWDFGDVIFIVEGRKIYVNKGTLAMSSEVFRVMFTTEFKERKMTEIPLPDKKFDDFLQLMQILQPLSNKCVDNTNVESLLPLAHEYQIHQVIERCEKVLVKQPPSIHNLILADKFLLKELRQVFLKHMKDVPISKIQNDPEFKMMDKDICTEIVERHSMHQEPSIKNLFLAEKYEVPEVYEKCMKYMKDTPLVQLKAMTGFTNLKPDTVIQVLTHKFEGLHTEVSNIVSWKRLEPIKSCGSCDGYLGASRNCSMCKGFRLEEISKVMRKY